MGRYVEVITELAIGDLSGTLTYSLPKGASVSIGARVIVSVSRKKHIGVVVKIHDEKPTYQVLPLNEIIDQSESFLRQEDIDLWQWVSKYYIATLSSVFRAAIPHSLRRNTFNHKEEQYIQLITKEDINAVLDSLKRAPRQSQALLSYLELAENQTEVLRSKLQHNATPTAILELCRKGILEIVNKKIKLPPFRSQKTKLPPDLEKIMGDIHHCFDEHETLLLHERRLMDKFLLYAQIAEKLEMENKQLLLLFPDGYSARAMYKRVSEYFKGGVVEYHPNISDTVRSQSFLDSALDATVVIGSRGALFLPMSRLGMVIVEQEHDFAYKHRDSMPRLNIRDTALVKARSAGAKVLLCSETPSLESYYNATRGMWGYLEIGEAEQSHRSFKVLERGKELLSTYLRERIEQTIARGEQALIFQNRRGFSQWVECGACFHIPSCPDCNVLLTYHKRDNSLQCHYCGYRQSYNHKCSECGNEEMQFQGRGTQRIEESLHQIFPEANIQRIDYDSTRGKNAFRDISVSIATDCNIIVGTQMVVRGIDFSRVGLIGIANADNLLSQADFRTSERAYSLLTMLSNRLKSDGEIIIQTTKRVDSVIKAVESRDQKAFYESELTLRMELKYPPAVRMIQFTLAHKDKSVLLGAASRFDNLLRATFRNRLSPPYEPIIDKIEGNYLLEFILRVERERSIIRAKEVVHSAISSLRQGIPSVTITADVDPL